MDKTVKRQHTSVRGSFVRMSKLHVLVGLFFAVQIIAYDAGKLITPKAVLLRWIMTSIFVTAGVICWYLARLNDSITVIRNLAWFLIIVDILAASFSVYSQRGMASRAVFLFALPILVAACLHRWGMIQLTAILSVVAYMVTAIAYFVLNFNEGYKIELYGEIGFYSALILAFGSMVWALVRSKH